MPPLLQGHDRLGAHVILGKIHKPKRREKGSDCQIEGSIIRIFLRERIMD